MKLVLDNAQSGGPRISLVDDKEIVVQVSLVISYAGAEGYDVLVDGKDVDDYPPKDGIILWDDGGSGKRGGR